MKKKTIYICIIVMVLVLLIQYNKKNDLCLNEIQVVKIAGDSNLPPFEYVDQNNNYVGFNVDIIKAIAKEMNINVELVPMSWNEACLKLENRQIDAIQGMKHTAVREIDYDFSDSYLENSQSIFVKIDNDKIDKLRDLSGKRVVIQQNDVVEQDLKKLRDIEIIYVKDQETAINCLINRDIDAYIGNTLTGVYLMNEMGVKEKVKLVGKTINSTKYCLAVKNDNDAILSVVNEGLKRIETNGTYDDIYRKWFGMTVDRTAQDIYTALYVACMVLFVFFIIVLIFYKWNVTLKQEVERQTKKINQKNKVLRKKNSTIRHERDFQELLLNSIYSGVVTINSDGVITYANRLSKDILRIEDLLGLRYKDTVLSKFLNITLLDEEEKYIEISVENEKRHIEYKVSKLKGIDNKYDDVILIFRDMTEKKMLEKNIRMKDKMQSLGNLVSGIAHEIRNPLTSIKTYTELIPKKYDNPRFRDMISKDIPCEIDRLNELISNLLEYSKPRTPFKEIVSLKEVVDGVMIFLMDNIKKADVKFISTIDDDLEIYVDKNHFRQVFINLILNAIECLDKESKIIKVYAEKVDDNSIYMVVEDNGCGIKESNTNDIFNPFFTTKASGTGLGLFIVYKLLEENNIQIRYETQEGEGTKFILKFKHNIEVKHEEVTYN